MRGLEATPKQERQSRSSLEKLALAQLEQLAKELQSRLNLYGEPDEIMLVCGKSDRLYRASLAYGKGEYLDAIDYACNGLDMGR